MKRYWEDAWMRTMKVQDEDVAGIAQPPLPAASYQELTDFSTTFPHFARNYVCFQQHSCFASEFSTAVLCFQ